MKCEIVCVIDKSGSMEPKRNDAIGGFNSFLEQQKQIPGEAKITVALFDHGYKLIEEGTSIQNCKPLTKSTYVPDGSTALLDAVGSTIDRVGERLHNTAKEQRPDKVIFVILTDGEENASHSYTRKSVQDKIKHQTDVYKWEFIYLGQSDEAWTDAESIGIKMSNYMQTPATAAGVTDSYISSSNFVTNLRSGNASGNSDGKWRTG